MHARLRGPNNLILTLNRAGFPLADETAEHRPDMNTCTNVAAFTVSKKFYYTMVLWSTILFG